MEPTVTLTLPLSHMVRVKDVVGSTPSQGVVLDDIYRQLCRVCNTPEVEALRAKIAEYELLLKQARAKLESLT